ncbi:MAG: hypothetical protein ABFE07_00430 [Armatimonadia bacterium]
MRSVFYSLFLLVTSCAVAPAYATSSSACYNITDADARTFCLAKARSEPSQCYAIQRADKLAECLAEVRK